MHTTLEIPEKTSPYVTGDQWDSHDNNQIENLISSIAFFTQTTEVNLIGEQLIALSFRLLEVLNQPLLYLWVSFNSSASGSYCLLRHMTTKFLFDHRNLEHQCLSTQRKKKTED
ncbi:hypothetical protein ILYODFUR_021494 [Ilyodon furcidens]|uniref:Uncharacterized protein n=1 Tax=Ilyodon furcidens TaxID=33524 RepID=A0ABV0TXP8_9TELE